MAIRTGRDVPDNRAVLLHRCMNCLRSCCTFCCRTILDIPEMTADFWRFFQQHWGPRIAAGQARIGLFNSQDGA